MGEMMTLDNIRAIAAKAEVDYCYWVDAYETSFDYCRTCADRLVAALHECGVEDAFRDGGPWASLESDGCRHCHKCGQLLEYSLTDYGVGAEREHFVENGVGIPITPDEAYHLIELEDAMIQSGESWLINPTETEVKC